MSLDYVLSIFKIIIIDIVLSGDNAVVIALAAHKLPAYQRKRAIMWGGGIAIFMRIMFTMIMAFLLIIPGLRLVGGLVLAWIAIKLLIGEEEEHVTPDNADQTALAAIRMIFIADFVMSLDNMLAVAGASHGDAKVLLFGLLVSIGIIMTCSALIARLMNRYKWIVLLGAGILALTAGEMILGDREVASYVVRNHKVLLSNHWDDWLVTKDQVSYFPKSKEDIPESIRDRVLYEDGELTFIGQMSEADRDTLLKSLSVKEGDTAKESSGGWFSSAPSLEKDQKAIEAMYGHAQYHPVPEWVPSGLKQRVEPWMQTKWTAEDYRNVQGRRYPVVSWIFYALMVGACLTAPKWWPHKRPDEPHPPAAAA